MNYEEKYEQALERARELLSCCIDDRDRRTKIYRVEDIESIFPDLQESKDERIRKEIIDFLRLPHPQFVGKRDHEKWIAWLEKQGQKPKKVSIWKHWKNGIAGNVEDKQIYLTKNDNIYSISSCLGFECDYIELSELDNLMLEKLI